jgi:hypothetical protein
MGQVLKKEVREHLQTLLNMTPATISTRLSEIKKQYPGLTPTAAAQELAIRNHKSLMRFLSDDDKKSLASISRSSTPAKPIIIVRKASQPKAKIILTLTTPDSFVQRHVEEINKAYNAQCYTATFILCRKVMENPVVEILRAKFPKNRDLFEDNVSHRSLDFSVVLDNLFKKRTDFPTKSFKAIERVKQKATPFKNDANDKAHSLFHIATKKEIDDAGIQEIFQLLEAIASETGVTI